MTEDNIEYLFSYLFAIKKNIHFIGIFLVSVFCFFIAFYIVKIFLNLLRKFL